MLKDFRNTFSKPIGLALMVMIYAGAPISGAHYNPAVSLAVMLRGKQEIGEMFLYWIFQLVGGTAGAWLGAIISGTYSNIGVGKNFTLTQAFLAEVCFAFVLCFVVLGTLRGRPCIKVLVSVVVDLWIRSPPMTHQNISRNGDALENRGKRILWSGHWSHRHGRCYFRRATVGCRL